MSRLQKKCVFAASGFHLLLLVILIVGPAFLSRDAVDNSPVITFIPAMTTDKAFSGGGNPNATPPPAAPAPPQPAPPTVTPPAPEVAKPAPAPEPQKVTPPEPEKKDPDSLEPAKPVKHKPDVSLKPVVRSSVKPVQKVAKNTDDTDAKEAANQARAAKAAAARLRGNLSSSTQVEMVGPGGGGPTYAGYTSVIQKIYYDAWIEPNADGGNAKVSLVIARDGTVISARIIQSSGSTAVDRSIQGALDRVNFIAPFPEAWTEAQRSFNLVFNLEAKKSMG